MATPKADLEAAAEPLKDELAALRADLAELAGAVTRIGKDRAAGLKSAANSAASEGYARGEAAVDVMMSELHVARGGARRRHPPPALRLARPRGALRLPRRRALPALKPVLFGQITRFAEARVKQTGRRLGFRAALAAVAALAFVVFLFFGLAGLAVWMTRFMSPQEALLVVAGGRARHRARRPRRAVARGAPAPPARRASARPSTASSSAPRRSRRCRAGCRRASVTGLGLVAAGALLVLLGRKGGD